LPRLLRSVFKIIHNYRSIDVTALKKIGSHHPVSDFEERNISIAQLQLGLYRLPIKLEDKYEIDSIVNGFKKILVMDQFADRIYATYLWKEENMPDPDTSGYKQIELEIQVEKLQAKLFDIDISNISS